MLPSSRKALREHVERFARYFLREMHKGGLQFEAAEQPDSPDYVPYEAYLLHADDRYIGACCFRDRAPTNDPPSWWLAWAWLHPYFRSRHHLTNAWPQFVASYGQFHLAQPVSHAMKAFIQKVGWHDET